MTSRRSLSSIPTLNLLLKQKSAPSWNKQQSQFPFSTNNTTTYTNTIIYHCYNTSMVQPVRYVTSTRTTTRTTTKRTASFSSSTSSSSDQHQHQHHYVSPYKDFFQTMSQNKSSLTALFESNILGVVNNANPTITTTNNTNTNNNNTNTNNNNTDKLSELPTLKCGIPEHELRFKTTSYSRLLLPPYTQPSEYKVTLLVHMNQLPFHTVTEKDVFEKVVGNSRFNKEKQELKLTCNLFASRLENKRHLCSMLDRIVIGVKRLAEEVDTDANKIADTSSTTTTTK